MPGTRTILKSDPAYPHLLGKIPDAPERLYVQGTLDPEEQCFALVGTRRCSDYGKQAALQIGRELADAGLTIVSGLAPGVDTWAHRAAVERNTRTIAVLGTGLDEQSMYPKENRALAKQILETGGALVSEYPDGTPGSKLTFPKRNRIISGLSLGTLVVEAKQRSGSLITANYARSQERMLFAVPGSIFAPNSKGTNFAIKELGAMLTESAADILRALGMEYAQEEMEVTGETKEETLILGALKHEAMHIEAIIQHTNLAAPLVSGALAVLEMKGKITNLGNNTFTISRSL